MNQMKIKPFMTRTCSEIPKLNYKPNDRHYDYYSRNEDIIDLFMKNECGTHPSN